LGKTLTFAAQLTQTVPKEHRLCGATSRVICKRTIMPKVKTHSRAKKTFKVSATGKIMYRKPYRGHLLTKKTTKRKRSYRIEGEVNKANMDFVKRLLRLK
jgi:large subunit ribosomal protein L35